MIKSKINRIHTSGGKSMRTERIKTDVLIIGGGTAGCFAAYVIGQKSDKKVLIAEKANIKRSGCLAAGAGRPFPRQPPR